MSTTDLLIFNKEGYSLMKEYENSFRGNNLIWCELWRTFKEPNATTWPIDDNEKMENLWRLDSDPNVPRELKILLISTFDHFLIKRENIPKFIQAIEKSMERKDLNDYGHFEFYAKDLKELINKKDHDVREVNAIGWIQTSVCDDVWKVYEEKECNKCGSIEITSRNYNIYQDNNHQFVFEYLALLEEGKINFNKR